MLRGEHGIPRAQVTCNANPLAHVEFGRIVGARRDSTGFVIVPSEGIHAEMKGDTELQFLIFMQPAGAVRSRLDSARGCWSKARPQKSRGRNRQGFTKLPSIHSDPLRVEAAQTPSAVCDCKGFPPPQCTNTRPVRPQVSAKLEGDLQTKLNIARI